MISRHELLPPWYLHLTPVAPHLPSTPEPKYAAVAVPPLTPGPSYMEADRSDKPLFVQWQTPSAETVSGIRSSMIRTLYSVDDQVDRLMTHLKSTGEIENTLIIYTSDNGTMWGEHGALSKFLPYKKSIAVPFLLRWPGRVAAGAVDQRPVTHVDIAPTVLAVAGLPQPSTTPFDGKNILSGHNRSVRLSEYWHDTASSTSIPTWASIRKPTYVYTEYYTAWSGDLSRVLQPVQRSVRAGQCVRRRHTKQRSGNRTPCSRIGGSKAVQGKGHVLS